MSGHQGEEGYYESLQPPRGAYSRREDHKVEAQHHKLCREAQHEDEPT